MKRNVILMCALCMAVCEANQYNDNVGKSKATGYRGDPEIIGWMRSNGAWTDGRNVWGKIDEDGQPYNSKEDVGDIVRRQSVKTDVANAKRESVDIGYIGLRPDEDQSLIIALKEAQRLKIGEVKEFQVRGHDTSAANKIGKVPQDATIFAGNDKVRYTQQSDCTLQDPSGNRIILDDQGNLVGKITPDGRAFFRSTTWERVKKVDFLSDKKNFSPRRDDCGPVALSDTPASSIGMKPPDLHSLNLDDPNGDWCKCEVPRCRKNMDAKNGYVIFGCTKCRKVNVEYAKMALELEKKMKAAGNTATWFGPNAEASARKAARTK